MKSSIESIAETIGLPVTAVYESRFIAPEDAFAYEVADAIKSGYKLSDLDRPKITI